MKAKQINIALECLHTYMYIDIHSRCDQKYTVTKTAIFHNLIFHLVKFGCISVANLMKVLKYTTSGQSNLPKRLYHSRIYSIRFSRIRQIVPMWPPSNTCFFGPIRFHTPNGILTGSAVFAQLTSEGPTMGHPFTPQNCPFAWGSRPPSNTTWFLGPTWVHNPNNISIGSAVFAGLTIMTDRQTNWPLESVCNSTPYLHT